jgi:phospholipid/cholesterol/gamma-HCH transport system substrate-binding protein
MVMLSQRTLESFVGLFLLAAIAALMMLAFKVSGLTSFFKGAGYDVTAQFDDIGGLKVRAPVKIGGVLIGEVSGITLDPANFRAVVTIHIDNRFNHIPGDSSVSILTAGLLGDNYLSVTPMYSTDFLKSGSVIEDTHSAMILEKLIGQLIYKVSNPSGDANAATTPAPAAPAAAPPAPAKPRPEPDMGKPALPDADPNKPVPEADPNKMDNPSTPVILPPKKPEGKGKTSPVEITYERFV